MLSAAHAWTDGMSSAWRSRAAKLTAVVVSATPRRDELDWVAFGGTSTYDFAFMVKILTAGGRPLPETRTYVFMAQAN